MALPASAQPVVVVRAETRIELRIERVPEHVRIRATLRDDRGDPLPDRAMAITVRSDGILRGRSVERTNEAGHMQMDLALPPGSYHVEAAYDGEASYDRVRVGQLIDLERAHVRLSISAQRQERLDRMDLDQAEHTLRVSAESPEGGSGLSVELSNELHEPLAAGVTGADGSVLLTLRSEALGPPAAGRLVVHTPGDERRARAQTEVLVVRFRSTALTLSSSAGRIEAGDPLLVEGELRTSDAPLARKAIGIFAGEVHLETVLTDADGHFSRTIELAENEGDVQLQAVFESDAPWRPEARSEPIVVRVEPRGSTPLPWLLVPVGLCAIALLVLGSRGRRAHTAAEPSESLIPSPPGIVEGAVGTGRTARHDIGGVVLDADESQTLPAARVELRAGLDTIATTSDDAGRFSLHDVPEGRWALRVACDGYEPRETTFAVPHRGALSSLEVRLRSLRQLALRRYQPLADALAPARRWWAFWTPRELADRASASVRRDVDAVTLAVEEAVYASAAPEERRIDEIGHRSERLAGELRDRTPR